MFGVSLRLIGVAPGDQPRPWTVSPGAATLPLVDRHRLWKRHARRLSGRRPNQGYRKIPIPCKGLFTPKSWATVSFPQNPRLSHVSNTDYLRKLFPFVQ